MLDLDNGVLPDEKQHTENKSTPHFSDQAIQTQSLQLLNSLSAIIPNYRQRDGQKQMVASVASTFNSSQILVAEAGTGTGKTFSYLIGALPFILNANKRLIVSTHTVSLQTQLMKKDLPEIKKLSGIDLKIEVAKGGEHYFCPRRAYALAPNPAQKELLDDDDQTENTAVDRQNIHEIKELIIAFENNRFDGDLGTLTTDKEKAIIPLVQRRQDRCPRKKNTCVFYKNCPFYEQRKKIAQANIVVTNHALLSIACQSQAKILGALEKELLVIDEAHHFPEVYRAQSKVCIALDAKEYPAKKLQDFIIKISKFIGNNRFDNFQPVDAEMVNQHIGKANGLAKAFTEKLIELDQFLLHNFSQLRGKRKNKFDDENLWQLGFELTPEPLLNLIIDVHKMSMAILDLLKKIQTKSIDLILQDEKLLAKLKNKLINLDSQCQQIIDELGTIVACCKNYIEHHEIHLLKDRVKAGIVRWIEAFVLKDGSKKFVISSNRCDISASVKATIFDVFSASIFTSATIRALGSFRQFNYKMGLSFLPQARSLLVASPFDYSKVHFSAPISVGDPNSDQYSEQLVREIQKTSMRHQAVLVIFNSYRQMNSVYEQMPVNVKNKITMQKKGVKGELVEHHCKLIDAGRASILFGVDSLAEGIDLKGKYLTCVMIAKFPFTSLSDPMLSFESKRIEFFGGSAFTELSLPLCSRKLIQCAGRLIRTETDFGEIILLDSRHAKRYGNQLIRSLPIFDR